MTEHPHPLLEVDAGSLRVIVDGEILFRAWCVAPHQYACAPGELHRLRRYRPAQRDVAAAVARAWRACSGVPARGYSGALPSSAVVRCAWFDHWRLWREVSS